MRPELCQRPIGDVLSAVSPVLIVGIEGKTLRIVTCCKCVKIRYSAVVISAVEPVFLFPGTAVADDYHLDFLFRSPGVGKDGRQAVALPIVHNAIKDTGWLL